MARVILTPVTRACRVVREEPNGNTVAGITLLVALFALGPAPSMAAGPYQIKSGMIETFSDTFGSSTTQEYFEEFGARSARYITTTVMGQTTRRLEIRLPDGSSYDIDLDQKSGTLMRVPPEAARALGAALAPQMMEGAKVSSLPARPFLGKACEGQQYEARGTIVRVWSWKGLPLHTEMGDGPGAMIVRATRVSEGAVPADRFKVPAGIRIEDLNP